MMPPPRPAALALAALVVLSGRAAAAQAVAHVRSVLPLQGDVLDRRVADVDGDGLKDLLLALRLEDGRRELRVHRLRPDGALPATPDLRIEVKRDVVCWGIGEFRPEEPGAELLFTTRGGAWVFSPRKAGARDNMRKIAEAELLLDLASDDELLEWPAVADADGDGVDEIVLATTEGFSLVAADGSVLGSVPVRVSRERRPAAVRTFRVGQATLQSQPLSDLLVPDEDPGLLDLPPLLFAEESLPLPYLEDADGDGLRDLIFYSRPDEAIHVHRLRRGEDGALELAAQPDPVVSVAAGADHEVQGLELVHAGGGPAVDLLLTRSGGAGGLSATLDWELLVFHDPLAPGRGLAQPAGAVAVDATLAHGELADLDGDGDADLGVSAWSLEFEALGIRGVSIRHVVSGYLQERGEYASRAAFRYERGYDADDFTAFSLVPPLPGDMDGDGLADLLESDAHGVLEIHPMERRTGRFTAAPARTFEIHALTSLVSVEDLNGDGVGDFLVAYGLKPEFEVLVSRRR